MILLLPRCGGHGESVNPHHPGHTGGVCTNRLITGTLEVQKGGTMRGNIEHTGGELSSNGKVLHTHKHPGDSGGTTGILYDSALSRNESQ
ncbi:hypothetical protein [Escherichia coli]|uniref:hypothetical protein n=1 Tax=Escherichia coli TaxID=562 RepID=UPI00338F7E15